MFLQPMPTMADRISTLPDSILCHILSYLPTKLAVATSILSRRWRPLWLSVSTLDFNDRDYLQNRETYSRFIHLVYTAMLLRDGSRPIKRFSLECASVFCDASMVNTLVTAATNRKVENLCLLLSSTMRLPSSVLTSRTLVVLNLKKLNVYHTLSSVDLPSLKTLHLRKVQFQEERYLFEILSACPVLEVLRMKRLKVVNHNVTDGKLIHLPKLVNADISESKVYFPLKAFYNVEFLSADVTSAAQYSSFLNLTYVELIFKHYCWDWLIDLLNGCPSLRNLVIDKNEHRKANNDWLQPHSVPQCLNTPLKTLCVRKYGGKDSELQFTSYIMQNARVLRSVTICSTRSSNLQEKYEMVKKLSLCPRSSATCQLYFE